MSTKRLSNGWVVLALCLLLGAVYLLVLYPWMMQWGATGDEATMSLPGDELVPGAAVQSTRVVTINAAAPVVWQWLMQLGQDRAGFYSNDWLENLTLADIHNQDGLNSEWQARQVGDMVLGAGGAVYGKAYGWHIKALEPGRMIYLWGSILVQPIDATHARLFSRTRTPPAPWLATAISEFSYDWFHFVMERGMLLGVKARAEGTLGSDVVLTWLAGLGWVAGTRVVFVFLLRRRWGWLLPPLAYAVLILWFTGDLWSAMVGFLWWGIVVAGFVAYGRAWWKGLALAIMLVIYIFVRAPVPHTAFGIVFLAIELVLAVGQLQAGRALARIASLARGEAR